MAHTWQQWAAIKSEHVSDCAILGLRLDPETFLPAGSDLADAMADLICEADYMLHLIGSARISDSERASEQQLTWDRWTVKMAHYADLVSLDASARQLLDSLRR